MWNLSNFNVCFLAGTLGQGGAERQLFYILQALCQAGAAPRLLSLTRDEFWDESIRALGVRVTPVDSRSRLGRLFRIAKELQADLPNVLQSQHFYTNAYVGMAAAFLRTRGVGAMRSNGHYDMSSSGPLGGWLNLHLPRIIAVNSQGAMRYAIARGVPESRLYFLPNVVDTDWFKPADEATAEPLTLVAVGRLVKEKRLDRFLSIVSSLRTNFGLNIKGLIVGPAQDENLRSALEDQARCLGLLPDIVQFLGGIPDLRPLYQKAVACVLTSDWEGTPNVLLEAMACGLPVVATQVGGVPEIVQHGRTGFLAEPDNLVDLVTALVELINNRGLRMEMGRRARAFVEENHSLRRLPAYLGCLYELVLQATCYAPTPVVGHSSVHS